MENYSLKKCKVPFGIVPNELLNNIEISMKAKGLFAFMQSKPDDWYFTVKMISLQTKDGVDSISEGLKELEIFGYLERKKVQTGNGFSTTYFLYFESFLSVDSNIGKSNLGKSNLGKSNLGKSNLGKSLNNSNKELSKKELSKKEESDKALAFFEINSPSEWETFQMRFRKKFSETEWEKFKELFECKVDEEGLEFTTKIISARLTRFAINYCENLDKDKNKFGKPIIELKPAYMLKPLS